MQARVPSCFHDCTGCICTRPAATYTGYVSSVGTQLLGGTLADRHGGKIVMAFGIVAFSAISLLMPLAVTQVCVSHVVLR